MKLAIMQPYFLPYIGYWQLMHAVDRFVVFDDVNFRKRGWINRNRIVIQGEPAWITVPVSRASRNRAINEHQLQEETGWRTELLSTIQHNYRRTPFYDECYPLLESVIGHAATDLAEYLLHNLRTIAGALEIECDLVPTSAIYDNQSLRGQDRILDICARNQAEHYCNLPGGRTIYEPDAFLEKGVTFHFLNCDNISYPQTAPDFIPYMSIADVLLNNGIAGTRQLLTRYSLDK